ESIAHQVASWVAGLQLSAVVPGAEGNRLVMPELLLAMEVASGPMVDLRCSARRHSLGQVPEAEAQHPAHGAAVGALRVLVGLLRLGRGADGAVTAPHAAILIGSTMSRFASASARSGGGLTLLPTMRTAAV